MYYFVIFIIILVVWSVWGYISSQAEQTKYSVISSNSIYEIRNYPEHLVATVSVTGTYREALNQGFSILARYIFGGNKKQEKISMTTPVTENTNTENISSESIAMTAPVTASIEGETHTISFAMPSSYNLETLPVPNDNRIKILKIPERKMATLRFSWYTSNDLVNNKKEELLNALKKDKLEVVGVPQYAGYNAPWTPPWMIRNEVMVEIK